MGGLEPLNNSSNNRLLLEAQDLLELELVLNNNRQVLDLNFHLELD
jgi:hypothetical protein